MIKFSQFLQERAMRSRDFKKIIATLPDLKIGFEAEFIVSNPSVVGATEPPSIALQDIDLSGVSYLGDFFDISKADRSIIERDYQDWVDEKRSEYVDDNVDEDAEDIDAERERVESNFTEPDFEEWVLSEFGGSYRTSSMRRIEALSSFVVNYSLDPTWGWNSDRSGVYDRDTTDHEPNFNTVTENVIEYFRKRFNIVLKKNGNTDSNWSITEDGSLSPDDKSTEIGVEVISPPMPPDEAFAKISDVFYAIEQIGYTNGTCGFHINMSAGDMSKIGHEQMLKMVLLMGEDHVLGAFNRQGNSYAKSVLDQFLRWIKTQYDNNDIKLPKTVEDLVKAARLFPNFSEKYRTVNFTKLSLGYLEFRTAGGRSYHIKSDTVFDTIGRFASILHAALDDNEAKEEFHKKAAKFISRINGSPGYRGLDLQDYATVFSGKGLSVSDIKYIMAAAKQIPHEQDADVKDNKYHAFLETASAIAKAFDEKKPNEKQIAQFRQILAQAGVNQNFLQREYPGYHYKLSKWVKK
jgi:Putative amidoligase enzyme